MKAFVFDAETGYRIGEFTHIQYIGKKDDKVIIVYREYPSRQLKVRAFYENCYRLTVYT